MSFIDARYDSLDIGFVLNGNKRAKLQCKTPLRKQFATLLNSMVDTAGSEKNEIIFHLQKLKYIVKPELESEYGFCFIRANIFGKKNNVYKKLADVDTLIAFNEADVTKSLLEAGNKVITDIISKSLNSFDENDLEYSYPDILNIEHNEKRHLKIYTAKTLTNGIYLNYNSFKNQAPDYTINKAEFKLSGKVKIKATDKEGNKTTLLGKDIYAFVDSEIPYVCAEYGCCIIERKNNNLFYVGRAKIEDSNKDYVIAETLAESLGKNTEKMVAANLTSKDKNMGYFLVMIDYLDGSFMKVKQIR